jgi:hypothetical protein
MNENNSLSIPPNYQNALEQTADHYNAMVMFVKLQMQRDIDYGIIPGTNKPSLLKPGAEKLCRLFNLRPHFELIHSVVIGHKLSLYRSCQGAFRKCLKEKLVRASLLVWEWCNN